MPNKIHDEYVAYTLGWTKCDHNEDKDGVWWMDSYGVHTDEVANFKPTTNIRSAWKLVTKFKLTVFPHKDKWYAGQQTTYPGDKDDLELGWMHRSFHCLESAETAELAICKATLALCDPLHKPSTYA